MQPSRISKITICPCKGGPFNCIWYWTICIIINSLSEFDSDLFEWVGLSTDASVLLLVEDGLLSLSDSLELLGLVGEVEDFELSLLTDCIGSSDFSFSSIVECWIDSPFSSGNFLVSADAELSFVLAEILPSDECTELLYSSSAASEDLSKKSVDLFTKNLELANINIQWIID